MFSFGVVLFEIFSGGENPWAGKVNDEVIAALKKGNRLDIPEEFKPSFVKNLIFECWKEEPANRPSFQEILETFYEFENPPEKEVDEDFIPIEKIQSKYSSTPKEKLDNDYLLVNTSKENVKSESTAPISSNSVSNLPLREYEKIDFIQRSSEDLFVEEKLPSTSSMGYEKIHSIERINDEELKSTLKEYETLHFIDRTETKNGSSVNERTETANLSPTNEEDMIGYEKIYSISSSSHQD